MGFYTHTLSDHMIFREVLPSLTLLLLKKGERMETRDVETLYALFSKTRFGSDGVVQTEEEAEIQPFAIGTTL